MRVRLDVFVYLRRVDVDMQYFCVFAKLGAVARYAVGKARANGYDEIGFGKQRGDRCVTVHAYKPRTVRAVGVYGGKPHDCGCHRRIEPLCESRKLGARARCDTAAARVDNGAFRFVYKPQRVGDVRLHGRTVRFGNGLFDVLDERLLNVFRYVYEYGTGAVRPCDMERLAYGVAQIVGVFYDEIMLGDRHGYARDVHFLKAVSAQERYGHVTRDRDDRHAVEICVGYARDEIGRPRTGSRYYYADLARRFCVAFGGVSRALLVRGEVLRDALFEIQCVEQVYNLPAGVAEYGIDSLFEQAFAYCGCAFDFHIDPLCEFFRVGFKKTNLPKANLP